MALCTGPLGFTVERGTAADGNVAVARDDNRLMLEGRRRLLRRRVQHAIGERLGNRNPGALYVEAEDLDELYATVREAGLRVVDPVGDRPWGQAEFTVEDGEGNWRSFWRRLG